MTTTSAIERSLLHNQKLKYTDQGKGILLKQGHGGYPHYGHMLSRRDDDVVQELEMGSQADSSGA